MYTYIKKLTVTEIWSNTVSIQVLLHQAEKYSISLVDCTKLRWKGAEKMPSMAEKRLTWKKIKRQNLCSNHKLASTQLLFHRFWIKFRRSKYDSDLFKIFDGWFIECQCCVHSDYEGFVIKYSKVFKCALNNLHWYIFKTKFCFKNIYFKWKENKF